MRMPSLQVEMQSFSNTKSSRTRISSRAIAVHYSWLESRLSTPRRMRRWSLSAGGFGRAPMERNAIENPGTWTSPGRQAARACAAFTSSDDIPTLSKGPALLKHSHRGGDPASMDPGCTCVGMT